MDLPDYQFEDPCPPNLRQVTLVLFVVQLVLLVVQLELDNWTGSTDEHLN